MKKKSLCSSWVQCTWGKSIYHHRLSSSTIYLVCGYHPSARHAPQTTTSSSQEHSITRSCGRSGRSAGEGFFSKLVFCFAIDRSNPRLTWMTDYWNKWIVLTGDVLAVDLITSTDTFMMYLMIFLMMYIIHCLSGHTGPFWEMQPQKIARAHCLPSTTPRSGHGLCPVMSCGLWRAL